MTRRSSPFGRMSRPLFWFSAVFLASLALTLRLGYAAVGMAVCGVLLLCLLLPGPLAGRREQLLLGSLACLAAVGSVWGLQARLERWSALAGQTADFSGWVWEESPYLSGRGTVRGQLTLEDGREYGPVLLDIRGLGEDLGPGSWIGGRLLVVEARQNGDAPGGVSLYCAALAEAEELPLPEGLHPLAAMAAARQQLSQAAWELAPGDDTAVVLSMVFSRQDLLSQPALEQINRAGIRHLLVVSGLHLSMAVGWVLAGCRQLRLGERGSSLAALSVVWLLAGLAGFSVSVVRAAVMSSLWLAGRCIGRRADSLTSLGLAALLLAVFSPPVVFQAGWQLTFAATLGVLIGAGPITQGFTNWWESRFHRVGRPARWALEGVATSLSAQLGTLPVLAAVFGGFSPWGILTTLLAMPFAAGAILLGWAGCLLLSWEAAAPGQLLFALARGLGRCILLLARLICKLPGGFIPVLLPYQLFLCFLAPAAVWGYLLLRPWLQPRSLRLLRRGMTVAAALILLYSWVYYHGAAVVTVSGSTGGVVIATPRGTVVLTDGEDSYHLRALSAQLLRCGAGEPVVLVCTWDSSLNGILWQRAALSADAVVAPEAEIPLLQSQLPGRYLPLSGVPAEVLPGVFVSHPRPQLCCVEVYGRKVLKSWAGYGIIGKDVPKGDLLVDQNGQVLSLAPGLRPGRMPGGETTLLLPAA